MGKKIILSLLFTYSYALKCMPIDSNKIYILIDKFDMIVYLNTRTYPLKTKKGKTIKWLLQERCLKSKDIEIVRYKQKGNKLVCDILFNRKSIIKELKRKGLTK